MKEKYKLIVLVLASYEYEVYKKLRKVQLEYYNLNPDVRVFMVYGNLPPENPGKNDLVFHDVEENYYPGMITKTIRAMEYIEENYDYDFLLRTNISTFWDFKRLLKRIETMPEENCFTGNLRRCTYKQMKSPEYVAGVNLILSRDLVQKIVNDGDVVCSDDLPEDWALSQYLIDRGHKPKHTMPRAIHFMENFSHPLNVDSVHKEIEDAKKNNRDHYRIKSRKNRDLIDAEIANILLYEYYGRQAVL
jgi:hypothetical protein